MKIHMQVYKITLVSLLKYLPNFLFAQSVQHDPESGLITNLSDAKTQLGAPDLRFNDPRLNNLSSDSISYDKVIGSPFWRDKYQPTLLYAGSKYITTVQAKMNLVTNEIYFLKDTAELVMDNSLISKIFFANDSAVFISQVNNLSINKRPVNDFVQVLNFGKYQLLKYTRRKVNAPEATSRLTKIYSFIDNTSYFITGNDKAEHIKKLNRENLLQLLPSANAYENWIKENNINLKSERDAVRFLNYYNAHLGN